MTTSFEDLGHRVFQGHGERCFNVAPARWILDGEEFLPRCSRLDVVFGSGKLDIRIFDGGHGDGYSMGLVAYFVTMI